MLTVDDLIRSVLGEGAVVLAGADYLATDVSWAAALRSRAPAFEGLKGGELAIVSVATLRQLDDRLSLARLIDQIAGLGVAAVAVIGEVESEALRAAERLRLPLIQLPPTVSARDLEGRVTRAIVERRAELQRRGQDLYHQLLELVVAGRGTEAVVARLAEITHRPTLLQDLALNLIALRLPPGSSLTQARLVSLLNDQRAEDAARLQALTANAADPPTLRLPLGSDGLVRLVAPVGGPSAREGYLSVVAPASELTAFDRVAVSRAAAACAIDLARERAARSDSDVRLTELLDELLAGSYPSEPALVGRAQRLGLDLSTPQVAIAFRAVDAEDLPAVRALERTLRREFGRRTLPPAIRTEPLGAVVLVPATLGLEAVRALIAQVAEGLSGLGGHLAAAIARPASGPARLREAIEIARRAVGYAVRHSGPDAVVNVAELGADELLLSLGPAPLLQAFREEWLGPLAAYDARNHTQLVETLAAYFAARSSPTEAAARLHLHRNTLLYRLQRIREITGRDPDEPAARLAFHLALRIDAVLGPGRC